MLEIKNINLDLKSTITCGQIFRYEEVEDSYIVVLSDRIVKLKMEDNNLIVTSNNYNNLEKIIRSYLDLDRDYNKINKELLLSDNSLKEIIKASKGFKIMHTPKLETCISYILSQNNGVPQIRNSLNLISKKIGTKTSFEGKEYFLFPSFNELKKLSVEDFHECKAGFRDKYLYEFINSDININKINNMETNDALEYLMSFKGIGLKVASCILLFAYQRFDVFPIDTWVKKYFNENYGISDIKSIKKIANDKFDKYSGLVIQYIFNYSRNR